MNELAPRKLKQTDFKSDVKPVWCPGCGDYHVLLGLTKALVELGRPPEEVAIVSGIGCSSRIPAYTSCYGFHGVHGRSLALATGLKVARPELTVLVMSGDGDGFSIGANHFLHACRRNIDLTYVVMNNRVYGMTKGQPSPTTEADWDSAMTPGGSGLPPFNPSVLALSAGANFVARAFSGFPDETARIFYEAVRHPGFSFVEVLSPCVTYRPEQEGWKDIVRRVPELPPDNLNESARRIMADDGFNIGILFRGARPVYPTHMGPAAEAAALGAIPDLAKEFVL